MISRRLGDLLLALLLVATLALCAFAVLRDPTPPAAGVLASLPAPSLAPSSAAPSARPTPAPAPVLLLAAEGAEVGHVEAAAVVLRWELGATLPLAPGGTTLEGALQGPRLVLVQASPGAAQQAADAARLVRAADGDVRLVLIGPLGVGGEELASDRDVLRAAAPTAGADFIDPVGSRWVDGLESPSQGKQLSAADRTALGARLVTALRRAESVRVSPSPSPSAG